MWRDCDLVRLELALLWAEQQLGLFANLGKSSPGPCKRKVLVPVAGTRSWRWSGTPQELPLVRNWGMQEVAGWSVAHQEG